ncbi:DNA polymerase III subunit delta' [Sphingomonas morindae]|uniref:DNA polymerase III subunit delta n=1 Tax=Sphingomonas morindae TaxID=1541170 RepID=A0ABY4XCJ3_9SPHN|nr:DNA polymerase III subunit delta' [Sphingomonas morindae]USI74610.1 DNA polymerase III subunit delta' [Sphingomonas morindae]
MRLFGQDAQIAAFREAWASGRMHHGWLLAGDAGLGKASFAQAAAVRLLAEAAGPPIAAPGLETPEDHRIARLVAAGSHPDLMRLERLYRDKTKDQARSITVDQVRGLGRLFATAPSFSPWRVVIVDAADDLERPGANALLKLLEEPPPHSLFLLVSHAPARLLPTIRSRCRVLRFTPLPPPAMAAALRQALPEAEAAEIDTLVAVGEGAPGRAVRYAGLDVAALDAAMAAILAEGDRDNGGRAALARALSSKAAQPRYELFLERVPQRIATAARTRRGPALAAALEAWEKARDLAGSAVRLSLDPQATVFELAGLLASLQPSEPDSRR